MAVSDPLFLDKSNPELWKSIGKFAADLSESYQSAGVSARTAELVNLRVSQINGCAYCLDLHARKALDAGESLQRINLLSTWSECNGMFTEEEGAALALAEAVTELPCPEERVAAVAAARLVLSEEQVSAIQWIAVAMNAFNRISIMSRHPVKERALKEAAAK